MRGLRFFEEYTDAARARSAGTVVAIDMTGRSFVQEGGVCYDALSAAADGPSPNGPVLQRWCNAEYLGSRCRRVSEARARAIHPRLFEYLDSLA